MEDSEFYTRLAVTAHAAREMLTHILKGVDEAVKLEDLTALEDTVDILRQHFHFNE
jgi:hypothetical protein